MEMVARLKCKDNYLPVGDSCVDENIIIGVSVGVAATILLGLIIALVIVGYKLDKKKKNSDHLSEKGHSSYSESDLDDAERAVDNEGMELDERSSAGDAGRDVDLTTFSAVVENNPSPGAAEAVHVVQHSQVDAAPNVEAGMPADYDHGPGLASSSVAAAVETKPASSDLYRSLYFPRPDDGTTSQEDDRYASFVPSLEAVDTETVYIIPRPRLDLQPAINYKDITTDFF